MKHLLYVSRFWPCHILCLLQAKSQTIQCTKCCPYLEQYQLLLLRRKRTNNTRSEYWEENSVSRWKSNISLLKTRTDNVLQNKTFTTSSISVVHRRYLHSWEKWKPQPLTCHTTPSNGKKGQLKSASSFVGSCGQDKLICILGESKNKSFCIFQV